MASTFFKDRYLTEVEVAQMLDVKPQTLSVWRSTKRYELPYVKVGRLIRYKESDLLAWLESRTEGKRA